VKHRRILLNGQPWLLPEPRSKYAWVPWVIVLLGVALAILKALGA